MAVTRLYLDMRGKAKDGKGSIIITIAQNGTHASIPTGIRIAQDNWRNGKVVRCIEADSDNLLLSEKKTAIDKAIAILSLQDDFSRLTAAEVKHRIISPKQNIVKRNTISSLFQEYMESGNLSENTKGIYNLTLKKILAFQGSDIKIDSIDLEWMRKFDKYLLQSQGVNGKAIYLRSFRAVCNFALHQKITTNYPFENFKIKQEETRKRSIPIELFRKFYSYPTSKTNSYYRDYFFLSFFLIGINTKDLLLAKKSQIVDGRLEYSRSKTKKRYSIKIEPEAAALLEKYKGSGDYLLEAMDHCEHYKSFAREINEAIQMIGETVTEEIPDEDNLFASPVIRKTVKPLIPGITTYYARHTWATLAHKLGISLDVISMALGHSFGNRTTLIYVKPDRSKVDEANRKVIDYLLAK